MTTEHAHNGYTIRDCTNCPPGGCEACKRPCYSIAATAKACASIAVMWVVIGPFVLRSKIARYLEETKP